MGTGHGFGLDSAGRSPGNAAPPAKDGKKARNKEEKQAAIKKARAKKSRKKMAGAREGAPRGEVRTINSRQFLDGIDKALNLDRY